jgi:hypothetical protein
MKRTTKKFFFVIFTIILFTFIIHIYNEKKRERISKKVTYYSVIINQYIIKGVHKGYFINYYYSNMYSIVNMNFLTNQEKILTIINKILNTNSNYKRKYIFSPVTPYGESLRCLVDIQTNLPYINMKARYWLWGKVNKNEYIIATLGRNILVYDKNISWYYQCPLENLSPDELEKEKEYRKEKGLPELK